MAKQLERGDQVRYVGDYSDYLGLTGVVLANQYGFITVNFGGGPRTFPSSEAELA